MPLECNACGTAPGIWFKPYSEGTTLQAYAAVTMAGLFYQSVLDHRALRYLLPAFAACFFVFYLFTNGRHDFHFRSSGHWNPWSVSAARQQSLDQITNATLGVRYSLSMLGCPLTNLQFEKVFAVNLASRTDYRDAMTLASRLTDFDM